MDIMYGESERERDVTSCATVLASLAPCTARRISSSKAARDSGSRSFATTCAEWWGAERFNVIFFFSFLCMPQRNEQKDEQKEGGRKLFLVTRKRISELISKLKKSMKTTSKSKKCRRRR
jgi:hypothetical protein